MRNASFVIHNSYAFCSAEVPSAWSVIMASTALLPVIPGIYHCFSLSVSLRADDTEMKSAGES